jgi:hypothetical protein
MYKSQRNYENAQRAIYNGTGEYQIPEIEPVQYEGCDWIGFNYASTAKDREKKGVHFFLDDYQFIRLWTDPDRYIGMLQQFSYVMSPDFSMYTDFPKALQIYNHYRKHWLAAYWQEHGIRVIPTICWSDKDSFEWCFDGEPTHSVVAISSVGTQNSKERKRKFLDGYFEMVDRLQPTQIIFYGSVPEECKGNIVRVKALSEKWNEAEEYGIGRKDLAGLQNKCQTICLPKNI